MALSRSVVWVQGEERTPRGGCSDKDTTHYARKTESPQVQPAGRRGFDSCLRSDMAVHQSVRGRASQISKFLEHNARDQQGSPLEIQVSFQEHGGKPVDAGRA